MKAKDVCYMKACAMGNVERVQNLIQEGVVSVYSWIRIFSLTKCEIANSLRKK